MSVTSLNMLKLDVLRFGLDDPGLLEVLNFVDKFELFEALYPGRAYALTADAEQYLDDLLGQAAAKACLARRLEYRGVSPALGDALWAAQQVRRKAQEAFRTELAPEGPAGVARSSGSAGGWRPHKKIRRAAGLGEADRLLMKKWGSRLAAIMNSKVTPSWQQREATSDPPAAMAGLVGKARLGTPMKRVRAWEIFAKWLHWNRGRSWPDGPVDLVDYLAARIAEGCPPSFPEGFRSAVLWMEARSGLGPGETFGRCEFFRKNVDRADVIAMTGADAVHKAPRLPIIVLGALECKVMCPEAPLGVRVVAWGPPKIFTRGVGVGLATHGYTWAVRSKPLQFQHDPLRGGLDEFTEIIARFAAQPNLTEYSEKKHGIQNDLIEPHRDMFRALHQLNRKLRFNQTDMNTVLTKVVDQKGPVSWPRPFGGSLRPPGTRARIAIPAGST